jgi:flagella basal body P-ring formation protein FlgA
MNTWITTLIAVAWICLIPWRVLAQDTIQLRPFVRLAGERVTLADVAVLQGPVATSLGGIVLIEDLTGTLARRADGARIELAMVREIVERETSINKGRLTISGVSCIVRPAFSAPAMVDSPAARQTPATPAVHGQSGTLRDAIARRIAAELNVQTEDLRLAFDQRQDDMLSTPVFGRAVAVHQTGSGEQQTFGVRVYEGDRLVVNGNVRVGVLVKRRAVIAKGGIAKGEVFSVASLGEEDRWLPTTVRPLAMEEIAGGTARVRLSTGDAIEARHVETSLAVRKGDLVSVDCVSGTVVIRTTARALQNGREGDVVPMVTLAWHKPISVRVGAGGRGVAVAAMPEVERGAGARGAGAAQARRN